MARRAVLGGALALAACRGEAQGQPAERGPAPPLKSVLPFPPGASVMTGQLDDPAYVALFTRHLSQLTPEWEMKMEYILRPDGSFRFDAPDRLARFARDNRLRLFGHALVWYAQKPAAFERIDGDPRAFAAAYRNYILAVAGRYRGQAVGWDVVNEAVAEDGDGLRESLWSRNLGRLDHMRLAFEHAREADPGAVLFINDYNLESRPRKRATYLRLIEDLLKAGAPLGGIGNQAHLNADLAPGEFTRSLRELASFGLPVHVAEIDISLNRARGMFSSRADLEARQARLYGEVVEAMMTLPARQRFALTTWGLRDGDSWLTRPDENPRPPKDAPLLFDDQGRGKPTFWAVADAAR